MARNPSNYSTTSPDIDRGWAYVVAFGAFMIYFLTVGVGYSSSVFYIIFLDEFEQTPSATAWIVTVLNSCVMVAGPVASYLTRWFTQRSLIAVGGLISTLGLIASSFVTSVEVMIVTFGIVVGVGWCLPYFFSFTQLTIYFIRKRRMALSFATIGCALGQFVYPPLFQLLAHQYHWRGAFIILAGINLNFFVIAALMMPPRVATSDQHTKLLNDKSTSEVQTKSTFCDKLKHEVEPLRNCLFNLFSVSALLIGVGVIAFTTHIGNYARVVGCDESQTTALVSCMGIGNLIGRLTLGPLLHVSKFNVVLVYNVCFATAGVVCLLSALAPVFYGLAVLSMIFGYSMSAYCVFSEVTIEIVGMELLIPALGLSFFTCSVGSMLGGPVAGWLFEMDPSYRVSFIAVGSTLLLSAALNLPAYVYSLKRLRTLDLESGYVEQSKS